MRALVLPIVVAAFAFPGSLAWAQDEKEAKEAQDGKEAKEEVSFEDFISALPWVTEGKGALGDRAEIAIPPGFRFADGGTANTYLQAMGNPPSPDLLGLIESEADQWFAVFSFEDVGYVEDDENDLDADDLLSKLRDGARRGNEYRREKGLPTVNIDGWAVPPGYNKEAKVLEWATLSTFTYEGEGSQAVNFRTKVLGRKGYLDVTVVCDPDALEDVLPKYRTAMKGFSFKDGERYDQFVSGDRVAEYGLAALIVGGAAAVGAKAGLFTALLVFFKKGAKLIVVGLAAIGAFIAKLFGGRKKVG